MPGHILYVAGRVPGASAGEKTTQKQSKNTHTWLPKSKRKEYNERMNTYNTNDLYCLVGLPYSGKSTYAKRLKAELEAQGRQVKILSSDTIRGELFGSEECQSDNHAVFDIMRERAITALRTGKDVILDATSLGYKLRMTRVIAVYAPYARKMLCHFMATPFDIIEQRQKERKRVVPMEKVVDMYKKNLWLPNLCEGWDEIEFIYPDDFEVRDYNALLSELRKIDHHNPHHTETIGAHCENAAALLRKTGASKDLVLAGLLHDIGKPITMTRKDRKGNPSKFTHFYGHERTSAYDALFYIPEGYDRAYVTALIAWHMSPYSSTSGFLGEGSFRDFERLFAADTAFYNDVMALHEADLLAG